MGTYRPYEPYTRCMHCDKYLHVSEAYVQWDGIVSCKEDYDRKHPALAPIRLPKNEFHPIEPKKLVGKEDYQNNTMDFDDVDPTTL